jgi:hypothetical protein
MRTLFLIVLSLFSSSIIAQKKQPIDSIVTEIESSKGMFSTYFDESKQKLFLQFNDSVFEKPLLMVSRYVQLPSGYSAYRNAGSKTAEQVIQFEKQGSRILLKQVSYINNAEASDPIYQSVVNNHLNPILASFEKENIEEGENLIDVSEFFSKDSPSFNVVGETQKKSFKIGGLDKKRSFIDKARSYPRNTEITHTLTYPAGSPPRGNQSETLTFQMNHSIIALPENPMPVRYTDHRVGWFSLEKYNYSSEALKSDNYRVAVRWRMEPKDEAAYLRGELVEPKKPIVFYLDPATPLKWRPYFKKGIEDWNQAFEKAGFKNAVIAKDPPSKEEDPDFSPEDVRYSVVRYVASTTRNATGPSVKDPRTGEILESDVIWYHNHLRSYRNRYLLETGAANPKARTLNTPEEEIGEMMRRVIAHEVGHALGLPHNMKASSAYPVDSLRSGSFTQKMGIAATIMDYARYNYIAQPGDENIRFVRQMGPYDDYAIEWGYRYFPDQEPDEIKSKLAAFVSERNLNPIYQFGSGGTDPDSQTENIGDDPIKATAYGLSNLKIVAKNLEDWTTEDGQNFDDLKELYLEMVSVYRRYIYHVANLVGGVRETRVVKGQIEQVYENVPRSEQLMALNTLQREVWNSPLWLIDPALISQFEDEGRLPLIGNLQKALVYRLLSTDKLNQMISSAASVKGNPLSTKDLIGTLTNQIVKEAKSLDALKKGLQISLVERLIELKEDEKANPVVRAEAFDALSELRSYFKSRQKSSDHFRYAFYLSENALK